MTNEQLEKKISDAFAGAVPDVFDDIMEDKVPLTKQLMDRYEETHASTLAVMKVPHEEVSKYSAGKLCSISNCSCILSLRI